MGFFDFLKKLKTIQKEEPIDKKQISIDDLKGHIDKENNNLKKEEQIFLTQIRDSLTGLIINLNEKIEAVKLIDIEEKKAEEKIKLIVNENKDYYLDYTNKLLDKLEEIKENENLKETISDINSSLLDFKKKSRKSFEKATYLIGEVTTIEEAIQLFSKKTSSLIDENKGLITKRNAIDSINKDLKRINELKESKNKKQDENKSNKSKINELEEKIEEIERIITKIKESDDYKEELNQKLTIDKSKSNLEKEIFNLKNLINFKTLTSIYHKNEKEMAIIKSHKDNFLEEFQKDEGIKILEIINSINQTDIKKSEINVKAKKIEDIKKNINNKEENIYLKETTEIILKNSEIDKLNKEIKEIETIVETNNKSLERVNVMENEQIASLKPSLDILNLTIDN